LHQAEPRPDNIALSALDRVKVRRFMIGKIHVNQDAEKAGNQGHEANAIGTTYAVQDTAWGTF
jgi:hypothetical protein